MVRKKTNRDSNLLKEMFNENLSASLASNIATEVEKQLKANNIPYTVGEQPKMENGKVIGCNKLITITDSEKFYNAIHSISESDDERAE